MRKVAALQLLRESATSFSNAFAQFPQCGPSRTSLLTGQYPFTSGNFGADLFNPSFRNETHLHQFLRDQGYLTAVAGKVFHARSSFYPSSWFDRTDADDNPKLDTQWPFNVCKNKVKTCSCVEGDDFTESSCRDFLTARAATRWMMEWETEIRPWFISVGLIRPHADYRVPDRIDKEIKLDWTRQVKTGMPPIAQTSWGDTPFMNSAWHTRKAINSYAAAVHYADDLIGTMLSTLESSGQLEDTAIILTSDHGMHLSDDFDHFGKWTLQDASLRVPFIFKPPRELNREAGVERDDLIELVDIFPTIADLAGFPVSDLRLDGTSVLARMQGAADDSEDNFAVSVLTICDGGKSAARHLPCTTKLRGGTDVDAVAYSIRTKRERRTEYRKLVISSENCNQRKTIEACTSSPGCMWSWWYIYKDAAQNHDYFCIANPGLSLNIDWSAEGLLGVELYDVLYDPMLNLANETFSENRFRSLLESVGI
ncbi:Iduronate 2-sulfatase [Hondaea fermentalgiana]|uniref:Iduronate 2-sulfatase n=1 Tax=Hondaea fermentalgiana TaxID=2315210 RepID=A0A2R5GL78_9STRA|nr:Iduronate 2-sulfatase [Hondaea fermentalgiana]|eukprot:GBG31662.1 Iduronate 2-sulfatase [Hondaea fermentalgiana]